ncbi:universal stress protein [Saccharothrix texasensis]|uniref:Nucleotide-binding universal stress UspA family protein n=1 Tax=Saccharothrix texasensis TaxID=103734 RepID=A0A3N1H0V1_9PSEU|nr:universal stress protein [Saccharothrix texasensis]ROP36099.1 nucleotide-binding universal stress UspA family protein [Saccharothrix texasensis]
MSGPIVVGVDGSASALTAVRWAAEEAARHRAPLELVHAYLLPRRGYPELVLTGHEVRDAFERQGRQWLADAADSVRDLVPEVRTSLVVDRPAAAMIAASRGARLVVLGSQGLGGFSGLIIGSVAVSVAAHGKSPVAIVRGAYRDTGPVVLGVDGEPAGEEAIAFAFAEASVRGTTLVALLAWTALLAETPYAASLSVDWDEVEDHQRQLLAQRLAGWRQEYPDVVVERRVVRERPAKALLDAARDARLLVVGSRGRGGFAGMLLGSTSQALVYHAPCPLVVVRAD